MVLPETVDGGASNGNRDGVEDRNAVPLARRVGDERVQGCMDLLSAGGFIVADARSDVGPSWRDGLWGRAEAGRKRGEGW